MALEALFGDGPRLHIKIATLGPEGTDSQLAAQKYAAGLTTHSFAYDTSIETVTVQLYPTYIVAVDSLVNGHSDLAIVASVAPGFHHFIFQERYRGAIKIDGTFAFLTDEMVLMKRKDVPEVKSVAIHPSARDLVEGLGYEVMHSPSKAQAFLDCLEGRADAALTSMRNYDPDRFDTVRKYGSSLMSWNIFARRQNNRLDGLLL